MKILLISIILSSCIIASAQASEKPSPPVPPETKAAATKMIPNTQKELFGGLPEGDEYDSGDWMAQVRGNSALIGVFEDYYHERRNKQRSNYDK